MNNSLNLASKPFSNRILPWALTAIILFVSFIGLILVVQLTRTAKKEADQAQLEMNQLKQKEQALLEAAKTVKASYYRRPAASITCRSPVGGSQKIFMVRTARGTRGLPSEQRQSFPHFRGGVTKEGDQTVAQLELAVFAEIHRPLTR